MAGKADTFTVKDSAPTLSWGTTSTIGTVANTALTVTMPANPNTNTTYTLTQDTSDKHKLIFTPSSGTATNVTIPDNNTTYSINTGTSNKITLTSNSGESKSLTIDGVANATHATKADTADSATTAETATKAPNYLPLSGGTMGSYAVISFANTGN